MQLNLLTVLIAKHNMRDVKSGCFDSFNDVFFVLLLNALLMTGSMQTKGACLVPKRGLNVMQGEVNRVLQLTSSAVVPITYQVPRKVCWYKCEYYHSIKESDIQRFDSRLGGIRQHT